MPPAPPVNHEGVPIARPGALAMVVVAAIVGVAAWLRFWHLEAGIPYHVGADEPQVMLRVAHMMKTGDLNPHFFDWPTLTFYMNLVVACGTFLAGAMRGAWSNLDQVGAPELYLAGRTFTAIVGTATVAVTFAAARRWGTGVGLLAAAMMAVFPIHVRESHYVLTDVPTAFFTTLTFLLALRAHERRTTSALVWAAVSAGLAASCKYNGGIAIVMPLVVCWSRSGSLAERLQRSLIVAGVGLAAFVAGTPYAVLDLPKFLNDYARLAAIFARERGGDPGWSIYLKHLRGAMGWPAFAAMFAGGVLVLRRVVVGPARTPAALVVAFVAAYFFVMARSFQIYGRYLLPLLPFVSLLVSIAVIDAIRWLKRARLPARVPQAAAAVLVVGVLAMPATAMIQWGWQFDRPSTAGLMFDWILANVPAGAKIAVEDSVLRLPNQYSTMFVKSLLEHRNEDYRNDGVEYFLAGSAEFQGALADPKKNAEVYMAYRTVVGFGEPVAGFDASSAVGGPSLRLYRMPK